MQVRQRRKHSECNGSSSEERKCSYDCPSTRAIHNRMPMDQMHLPCQPWGYSSEMRRHIKDRCYTSLVPHPTWTSSSVARLISISDVLHRFKIMVMVFFSLMYSFLGSPSYFPPIWCFCPWGLTAFVMGLAWCSGDSTCLGRLCYVWKERKKRSPRYWVYCLVPLLGMLKPSSILVIGSLLEIMFILQVVRIVAQNAFSISHARIQWFLQIDPSGASIVDSYWDFFLFLGTTHLSSSQLFFLW